MFRRLLIKYLPKELNFIFLFSGLLLSISILFSFGAPLKTILFLFFCYQIIHSLKNFNSLNKILIFVNSFSLLSLIPYFSQTFTKTSISILIMLIAITGSFFIRKRSLKLPNWQKMDRRRIIFLTLIALPALLIALLALQSRTGEPILSVWQTLSPSIFIIYGVLIFNFLFFKDWSTNREKLLGAILIYFTSTMLSAIIFKEGFGFDPFIHRSAVNALISEGLINPLTPLYSGQYASIGTLNIITGIPLKILDIWLLPVLSATLLPLAVFSKNPGKTVHYLAPLAIPYMLLTFTVPFSYTFLILLINTYILSNEPTKRDLQVLLFTNFVGIFWHPLIMIGSSLFISILLTERAGDFKIPALIKILSPLSIPALIIIYQIKNGGYIDPLGPIFNLDLFLELFRNPFAIWNNEILLSYRALYAFRYFFPMLLTLAFLILSKREEKFRNIAYLQIGLLLAIYAISTLFYFNDIVPQEQREFSLRLLQGVYSMSFIALLGLTNNLKYLLVPILVANWFFTYPQYNAINPYTSPSVSSYDKKAVQYIHENTEGPYIVLSNQMMSASALETYGFHEYVTIDDSQSLWYPIPTGAKLYDYYFETYFYEARPILKKLQEKLPNHQIYLAFHNYWPLSLEKEKELRYTLKEFYSNKILTIYKYEEN